MLNPKILPGAALAGGVVCLIARHGYLSSGLEAGTGLPVPHAPSAWVLWGLMILCAVVLGVLSRGPHRTLAQSYTKAFRPGNFVNLALRLGSVVLFALGGFLSIAAFFTTPVNAYGIRAVGPLRLVAGILALASAAGLFFLIKKFQNGTADKSFAVLLPGFTSCFWLIDCYPHWAENPTMGQYLVPLLAGLLAMLACCLIAAFACEKARVGLTLWTSLLSVAFTIACLGDGLALQDLALQLAFGFYLLSMASALAQHDRESAVKPQPEPSASAAPDCGGCPGCASTGSAGASSCSGCASQPAPQAASPQTSQPKPGVPKVVFTPLEVYPREDPGVLEVYPREDLEAPDEEDANTGGALGALFPKPEQDKRD